MIRSNFTFTLILVSILSIFFFSCSKTNEEVLVMFEDLIASSNFNTNENKLNLTLTESENVSGLQFEVVNSDLEQLTIHYFEVSPTYNLYEDTCFTNETSNNVGICIIASNNVSAPISSSGIFSLDILIEESDTAQIQNLIVTNKNLETYTISNIEQ